MAHSACQHISEVWDRLDIILAPTYAEATSFNAARAATRAGGAFGTIAQTFDQWIEGLWERYGDGRRFASDVVLAAALAVVLDEHEGELENRPGLGVSVLRMLEAASGLPAFDEALSGSSGKIGDLLPAERELLECVCSAKEQLADAGYIERGDAAAWLAHHADVLRPSSPWQLAVLSDAPLPPLHEYVVGELETAGVLERHTYALDGMPLEEVSAARLARPADDVRLRFAFPSGDYATPQVALRIIEEHAEQGPIAIASADPLRLYRRLAPAAAERGIKVSVRAKTPFLHTAFGRAYGSLRACLEQEMLPWDRALLADAFSSPLLRTSLPRGWERDLLVRGNRLTERTAAMDELCRASGIFSALYKIVTSPSIDVFHVMEERIAHNSPLERPEVGEALSALQLLEELHEAGLRFGIESERMAKAFRPLVERAHVRVALANYEAGAGEQAQVSIMSLSQASRLGPEGCATLVCLDLDSASYPMAAREDSLSRMLDKLGVCQGESPMEQQRRMWSRLTAVPSSTLVLARCLNNESAEPRYHCAMLEELIDLYREDPSALDDIDNIYALPEQLQAGLITAGEGDLPRDVSLAEQPRLTSPSASCVDDAPARIARRGHGLSNQANLALSPSQIESYIACPAKWFAERRLGASIPDEVMGPAQQGTFRHDVLQRFYELFREAGGDKPRADNYDLAERTFEEAFELTKLSHLELLDPGRRAAFLMDTTEERVLELIHRELSSWLDFESRLLAPGSNMHGVHLRFLPAAFEFDIREFNIEYAGVRLAGIIDRIDVDKASNSFVVIDYKGRLGKHYNLELDNDGRPIIVNKIQALIYAHALLKSPEACRALGLEYNAEAGVIPRFAGALYVSYLKGNAMRGVTVKGALGSYALPTISGEACIEPEEVMGLLESIEQQVGEQVVAPMLAGQVEPDPSDKNICTWCGAFGCLRRS